MRAKKSHYEILGVPTDAGHEGIRRAYRSLARQYHPDVAGAGCSDQFREITEAYEILGNPERRAAYDEDRWRARRTRRRPPLRPEPVARAARPAAWTTFGRQGAPVPEPMQAPSRPGRPRSPSSGLDPLTPSRSPIRLTLELTPEATRRSHSLRIMVPGSVPCTFCLGEGLIWGLVPCPACYGRGERPAQVPVTVRLPAGMEHNTRFRQIVDGRGHGAVELEILVRVTARR